MNRHIVSVVVVLSALVLAGCSKRQSIGETTVRAFTRKVVQAEESQGDLGKYQAALLPVDLLFANDASSVTDGLLKAYERVNTTTLIPLLLSVDAFIRRDIAETGRWRRQTLDNNAGSERLKHWIAAYVERYPDRPWSHFIAGCGYEALSDMTSALSSFRQAQTLAPNDVLIRRCREIVAVKLLPHRPETHCRATATGTMRIKTGPYGYVMPLPGETVASGDTECKIGQIELRGTISGTTVMQNKNNAPIGWGVLVTSGELLMSAEEYDVLMRREIDAYASQLFDAAPLDYGGEYVQISLSQPFHKFVIPVQVYPDGDSKVRTLEGEIRGVLDRSGIAAGFPLGTPTGMSVFGSMDIILNDETHFEGRIGFVSPLFK